MKDLRRNEFIDMLEMAEVIFNEHEKFIKFELPFLGNCTFYPKANKVQIDKNNKWEENGFDYVKNILKKNMVIENMSLVYDKKSDSELRNQFAGLAMQGICVNANRNSFSYDDADSIADYAYIIADAMVKRSKL